MKKKEASVAGKKAKKGAAKKAAPKKAVKKTAKPAKKTAKKAVKKAAKPSKAPAKAKAKSAKPAPKAAKKVSATTPAKKSTPKALTPAKSVAPKSLQNFLTPLDDRIVVRLSGADKMTAGGLYIPDTVSDVSGNLRGHVVAIGRGHRDNKGRVRPMDVTVGDQVIFAEFSGSKIKLQNEDFIILREAEVMGIVSK